MKNVASVICEDEFIFDVVLTTLREEDPHDQPLRRRLGLANLGCGIELDLAG
jgi:hypothetical protein